MMSHQWRRHNNIEFSKTEPGNRTVYFFTPGWYAFAGYTPGGNPAQSLLNDWVGRFFCGVHMRARNLKPGFFKSADLAEIPYEGRLLFAGLWCLADRRGRLEDRPKQIRGEVLPHDNVDVPPLLEMLQKHGFILRYEKNDKRYIQIANFDKHQSPHIKEAESTIPAPDKHQSRPIQKPLTPSSLTPDSRLLTPHSTPGADKPPVKRFVKPTPEEVSAFAKSIDFELDGHNFVDHYESKGWVVGRAPMKNWQACVRTWKRMRSERGGTNGFGAGGGGSKFPNQSVASAGGASKYD